MSLDPQFGGNRLDLRLGGVVRGTTESDVVDGGRVLFALTLSENSYFFGVFILTNYYYLFVY